MLFFKNDKEKTLYEEIMKNLDARYDENVKMLREWRGENGYHSRLVNQYVHSTNASLGYAYELLNRGGKGDFQRAADILRKVVPLQDVNPENHTYGIWSYFVEESLEEMNPPDWNWADFCGKRLIQIFVEFGSGLPSDVRDMVREAILHACNSIIRRDMGPGYTNISIMGTLVTMAAGENLGEAYLTEYAQKRLGVLYDFNMKKGCYQEYNSPSYTWVVIDDIASMICYIRDEESLGLFRDLNDLAWRCIAEHYHYKTGQWAGPHARFYAMLEDDQLLMRIQRSLNYQIHLVDLGKEGLADRLPAGFFSFDSVCPDRFRNYFVTPNQEAAIDAVFVRSEKQAGNEIAVCRQAEAFTLGTFYRSTFWNQRRNHMSYFGTAKAPVYCALKCLHDGYDYSSGLIVTAQEGMRTVSVIGFGTNGGDTHCNLDMVKNAAISAEDMRIRFEIGGAVDDVELSQVDERTFLVHMADASVKVRFPYGKYGEEEVRFRITEEREHANETGGHKEVLHVKCIDAVLYAGARKVHCFREMEECCCGVSFEIVPKGGRFREDAAAVVRDGILTISQEGLEAKAPVRPCRMEEFSEKARAYRAGREYGEIYLN
ncbi:MAG: hypothetical protein HFH94_00060 [Lachnospiraceae bacterium]|nr:hypothetical protein [uncultured Acetatifactor sp.]MCI9218131.1 hypothetical protein [Lachnospiraceae bacterium]